MNLLSRLYHFAQETPEKEALLYGSEAYTYEELWAAALSLASGLKKLGLKENDRIMLVLPNCPEFVISYYGTIASGGAIVPINPAYTSQELGVILADSDPFAVITSSAVASNSPFAPLPLPITVFLDHFSKSLRR